MGDEDYEGCRCSWPNARPPCGWCVTATEEEYEEWRLSRVPKPKPDPLAHIEGYATF